MSRALLGGLAAIALLLAGGLVLVVALERAVEPGPARAPAPPAEVERPRPDAPPAAPAAAPAPTPVPAASGSASWLSADVRERRAALQGLTAEVDRGLSALDARVVACNLARPELVLTLESLERRVYVADVRVHRRDPGEIPEGVTPPPEEDEAAVACARRALLGERLDAPSARPGRRWDMSYMPRRR